MARIIPKPLAQWIKDDPQPNDPVAARRAIITASAGGKFMVQLRGNGADGMRYTTHTTVDEVESGISAAGSMPSGWERAVSQFLKMSGNEK